VVHGLLLAADAPAVNGHTVNLATGGNISLLELVARLNKQLGTDLEPSFLPARAGDVKHSRADVALAQQLMGYTPIVSFEEGLARTIAWYRG
jgi:UDP-glucose 4-epimerase